MLQCINSDLENAYSYTVLDKMKAQLSVIFMRRVRIPNIILYNLLYIYVRFH